MRDNFDHIRQSKIYKFFLGWHLLAMVFALIIGIFEGNYDLFLSLMIWTIIIVLAYKLHPSLFILSAFILAAIEEFIVYQFGGGLQGAAISLTHDYVNALPVFLGIIVGWYLVIQRYNIREDHLYVLVGVHGALIELVFQGILFDPILLFLLGGPNFFIYGSIIVTPQRTEGEKEFNVLAAALSWLLVTFFLLLGAIVADNLNRSLGYPTP